MVEQAMRLRAVKALAFVHVKCGVRSTWLLVQRL